MNPLWLLLIYAAKEVDGGVEDGSVLQFTEQQIAAMYALVDSYEPAGFEALGGKFLNSTRNNKPVAYSDITDNGSVSVDKIRSRYTKAGVFLVISIASACLFCLMAPCFAICCIFKKRKAFFSNSGERYKATAQILLFLTFSLFLAFAVITAVSSSNLYKSMDGIVRSIGSVYVGGMNFTVDTKQTFSTVLDNMAGFANNKITTFKSITINEMINKTQGNLTVLSSNLNTSFIEADVYIGNVADGIMDIDGNVKSIKTTATNVSTNYTNISTKLRALDGTNSANTNQGQVDYTPKSPRNAFFSNLPAGVDTSAASSLPDGLDTVSNDVSKNKGKFSQQATQLTSNMQVKLSDARTKLQTQFDDFSTKIDTGRSGLKATMNQMVSQLLNKSDPIDAQFAKYTPEFTKYNTGRNAGIIIFLVAVFGIIILSLLCIKVKQRRVAMSLSSCLFLLAAISMTLSIVHYLLAFGITEVCDQLNDGFPILEQMGVNPGISNIASAGLMTVDMCSQGKKFDQILESPVFTPYLPANFTDYLNITKQYDKLMSKYNITSFTSALDDFQFDQLFNTSMITDATQDIQNMDFSQLNFTASSIDTSSLISVKNSANVSKTNDVNQFTYSPAATSPNQLMCVADYNNRIDVQVVNIQYTINGIDRINLDIQSAKSNANQVISNTNLLKNKMTNITLLVTKGVNSFAVTIDTGKSRILSNVDQMPAEILALVVAQYNLARDAITCTILGQTMKVMEYQLCSLLR
eukprot:NODE_293_length_10559_cov_1.046463.p1 type:complete len:750 gc:universal NODE_293_length_10559_cov_1.046463:8919-6670(-)